MSDINTSLNRAGLETASLSFDTIPFIAGYMSASDPDIAAELEAARLRRKAEIKADLLNYLRNK